MKHKYLSCLLLLVTLIVIPAISGDELPIPTFDNSLIISLEHLITNSSEIDYVRNNFNFGLYTWLSFSYTHLDPVLAWQSNWNNASAGIQAFKDRIDQFIQAARNRNVKIHIVMASGLARGLEIYRDAKLEDIRNAQWYNDNKIASDTQMAGTFIQTQNIYGRMAALDRMSSSWDLESTLSKAALDKYVFGTLSRYARKMRANLEAKAKAALAFLKQRMDQYPDVLIAVSGWGESELNYHRINHTQYLQDFFCDFSPFAILEFKDWIQHQGLYNDANGKYRGEGYSGEGRNTRGQTD